MKELAQGLDCYRSRLGLDFKGLQGNGLQFTFTKIDPQDPDREFSFVLLIKGENDYECMIFFFFSFFIIIIIFTFLS